MALTRIREGVNKLTANTNGGKLTVMGTATSRNSDSVTVNGTNALVSKDATFAATNMPLVTSYTAVAAEDGLGGAAASGDNADHRTNRRPVADGQPKKRCAQTSSLEESK
jgi:hypothetical protein